MNGTFGFNLSSGYVYTVQKNMLVGGSFAANVASRCECEYAYGGLWWTGVLFRVYSQITPSVPKNP